MACPPDCPPVTSTERRWAWGFGLAVMAVTSLPYLLGWWHQTPAWRFSGFLLGVEDGFSYLAKMMRGAAGDWLYRSPYTPDAHPVLAVLPYLLLGKLIGPHHTPLVWAFHFFRVGAGLALVHATYDFLACFLNDIPARRWGTALITLGAGLDWLLLFAGRLPLSFYSPEAFGFLMSYGLPHLALARALLLWGWVAWWGRRPLRGGLCWLGCGLAQPITLAIGWAVLGVWMLVAGFWRKRPRALAAFLAPSAPLLGYTVLWQRLDPYFHTWAAQNVLSSPAPWVLLLAYGALLPWATRGARALWRTQPAQGWWLVLWAVLGVGLAYLPVPIQRRLLEGVWVALVGLAMSGRPARGWRWATLPLWVSTVLLLMAGVQAARRPAPPVFLPEAEVGAFQRIASQVPANAVVLCAYSTGNALPAWAPVRVVLGHGVETPQSAKRRNDVMHFFHADTPDAWREAFLHQFGVQYLLIGPAERALGDFVPAVAPYLRLLWQAEGYSLWQVR